MLESAFNEENQCFYPSETFLSCQIACQNGSTSITTSSNPSLSNFYHMLTEIKEQVYRLFSGGSGTSILGFGSALEKWVFKGKMNKAFLYFLPYLKIFLMNPAEEGAPKLWKIVKIWQKFGSKMKKCFVQYVC